MTGPVVNLWRDFNDAGPQREDDDGVDIVDIVDIVDTGTSAVPLRAVDGGLDTTAPVDLWGHFEPPPPPVDDLPAPLRGWVREQSELIGVDPAVLTLSTLVIAAAACGDGWKIRVKEFDPYWIECPRLWGAVVGDPSIKKTPAISTALRPVVSVDMQWCREDAERAAELREQLAIYKKAMDHYIREKAKGRNVERPPKPPPVPNRRILIQDTTTEALTNALRDNERGILVVRDELSGWFASMDAYRDRGSVSLDRAMWLQAFNGGSARVDRVGRGAFIVPNMSACVLGNIQPAPMRKIASNIDDDGLLQRFMVVIGKSAGRDLDRHPDMDAINSYKDVIEKLYRLEPREEPVTLSTEAQAVRRRMTATIAQLQQLGTAHGSLASHLAKCEGIFARLLLLFHIVDASTLSTYPGDNVDASTAERVERLMTRFLIPHAFCFYTNVLGHSEQFTHAQWIAGHILSRNLKKITKRDISRAYRNLRDDDIAIDEAMVVLQNLSWVDFCSSKSSQWWQVNPRVHELYADRAVREREARDAARQAIHRLASLATKAAKPAPEG